MPFIDLFHRSPSGAVSFCLYLLTIFSATHLVRRRQYGPDRLLLALIGLVSTFQGAHLLQEAGVWISSSNARLNSTVSLTVAGLYLIAVWVVARWSREHQAARRELRLAYASSVSGSDAKKKEAVSYELLTDLVKALPLALRLQDSRHNVLLEQLPEVDVTGPTWSVPVGNPAAGYHLVVQGIAAPPQSITVAPLRPSSVEQLVSDANRDRRRQLRLTLAQPIRVEVQAINDSSWTASGYIRDFSGGGLGLDLRQPVTIGTALLITMPDALVLGEVCHCQEVGGGFRLGLRAAQFLATGDSLATQKQLAELSRLSSANQQPARFSTSVH